MIPIVDGGGVRTAYILSSSLMKTSLKVVQTVTSSVPYWSMLQKSQLLPGFSRLRAAGSDPLSFNHREGRQKEKGKGGRVLDRVRVLIET